MAVVGTVLAVGACVYGTLAGPPVLRNGAGGVVCALALALYLIIVRTHRVLVGVVVLTGMALSVLVPRVTAEIALAERGHRQEVTVTAVLAGQSSPGRGTAPVCSYTWQDGTPVSGQIRRGCHAATTVGERITVMVDPTGVIPPRAAGPFRLGRLMLTVALALLLPLLCAVAVARSYRFPVDRAAPRRAAAGLRGHPGPAQQSAARR